MALERRLALVTDEIRPHPGQGRRRMQDPVVVAFATNDMKRVNQHFGAADCFVLYELSPAPPRLVAAVQFGTASMDGDEDKLAARIAALGGCVAVFCQAVGSSAIERLRSSGIQAVKVPRDARIRDLLASLAEELERPTGGSGPEAGTVVKAGLDRASAPREARDPRRFDAMEREGWIE